MILTIEARSVGNLDALIRAVDRVQESDDTSYMPGRSRPA